MCFVAAIVVEHCIDEIFSDVQFLAISTMLEVVVVLDSRVEKLKILYGFKTGLAVRIIPMGADDTYRVFLHAECLVVLSAC